MKAARFAIGVCVLLLGVGMVFFENHRLFAQDALTVRTDPIKESKNPKTDPVLLAHASHDLDKKPKIGLSEENCRWSRFPVGAWTKTRTVSQSFENKQLLKNVTETYTVLKSVEEDGYTLEQKNSLELGNKKLESNPITRRYDFLQQPITDQLEIQDLADTKLTIDGTVINCKLCKYTVTGGQFKQIITVWYSQVMYPHILQVEAVKSTIPSEKEPEEKILHQSQTVLLDIPSEPSPMNRLAIYRMKTVKKAGGTTSIRTTYCSKNVPGGIVRETITETDRNGIPIRQSESNLEEFSPDTGMIAQPEMMEIEIKRPFQRHGTVITVPVQE